LAWFENIPLLSFVVLRGKCRTCSKKIDWSYPLVEGVTGVLFLWWATLGVAFFRLSQAPLTYFQPLFWLLVGLMLVVIFFSDVLYMIIPDYALVVLGVATLAYRGVLVHLGVMRVEDFYLSLASGAVGFLVFLALFLGTRGRGMGFGDVKFAFIMGFLVGFPRVLIAMFVGFLTGGIYGGGLLLMGKKKFGSKVAFGPFLVVGLVTSLLWGEVLWSWYWGLIS